MMKLLFTLILCGSLNVAFSQTIPTAPNQRNAEGKRVGPWVITYTKTWKETALPDSIAYYRVITFDTLGTPQDKTTDYHSSGKKQWEGVMLQIEPSVVIDGLALRYNEKGDTVKAYYEGGIEIDLLLFEKQVLALYNQGRYAESRPVAEKYVKITTLVHGKFQLKYAESLKILGDILYSEGRYPESEVFYLDALIIFKKLLGEQELKYLDLIKAIAVLYHSQGQYLKSEKYFKDGLEVIKRITNKRDLYLAKFQNGLGSLYFTQGQYTKSEQLVILAIEKMKGLLDTQSADFAFCLSNLALIYIQKNKINEAESLYIESLEIRKKTFGNEHPLVAYLLNGLAALYSRIGQYKRAEILFIEAIEKIGKLDKNNLSYALYLNNLGYLYAIQNQYSKAEPLYIEAMGIRKKILGENHHVYATSLNNLGIVYTEKKQFLKAEEMFLKSLEIKKEYFGDNHPSYQLSLNNMAVFYERQGLFHKAEPLHLLTIEISKNVLGKSHSDYASYLNNLAYLYFKQGQLAKSQKLYVEAYNIEKANLLHFFEATSEKQQETYYNKNNFIFNWGFSCISNYYDLQRWAYNNVLFIKGLRLASASGLQVYLNQSTDTALVNNYQQYLSTKRTLGVQYSKPIKERFGVTELENQAELLEKELMRKSAAFRDFKKAFQITFKEVQKALKPNQVAIEFIDYRYHNGKKWTDTTYYAALVLRPGWTSPKMVVLCEKKQLEAAILGHGNPSREAAAQTLYSFNRGVPVAEAKSQVYQQNLYQLLWKPIDSLLAGVKTIYYSPSGLLHRLNLEAIAVSPAKRLGEVYEMSRLSSTRQLAQAPAASTGSARSLLVGGVNYDADSLALAQVNQLYQTPKSELTASRSAVDSRGKAWVALANTGPEVKAIAAMSKTIKADTLLGNRATEEAFSHYLQFKPRIVHLATHGFFYEPPKDTAMRKKDEPAFVNATDALMRSGLVLAGANGVWQGKAPLSNQEDGILTAYEISLMDFRNTDLVVLSACETGLGDIKGSEGVFGLQRAFKIAGAKNIIMSLWKVPDKATRELMEAFYGYYLKEGKSIRESFKLAVNRIRQQYSEPYYWAAFVLTE